MTISLPLAPGHFHLGQVFTSTSGKRASSACGAVIDLWQTDEDALYDNIDYGYRGHQFTGPGGEFEVSTVFPKGYGILGLVRSPHIHVKAQGAKTKLLTTQIFFPEDAESHARAPRFNPRLVVDLRQTTSGPPVATFDFVLEDA
ncbi:uncharacterized protein SOCE26_030820 [Sorangium cellulosum]|uniref:Intradiol ring-cleavage dioxygenases domain-containing protein n=1 Tax=Sorangium cellulosum TaxID=56 RepID=A0A2L0EQW6_SORCE|nr:hypothetical protein [Sorangium cellulosum]AUX41660.1 uncharacterized protein SOCE26_030820 [Sorangium cellulosum]